MIFGLRRKFAFLAYNLHVAPSITIQATTTMNDNNAPAKILIVDDHQINIDLISASLSGYGYVLSSATSGHKALEIAKEQHPDLILLDMSMPVMSGQDVIVALKTDPEMEDIPVIFVSAIDDLQTKIESFKGGAVDYITKPFRQGELQARIKTHITLRRKQLEVEQLKQQELAAMRRVSQLKDDMMRMVSHDIKSPLSNILSGIRLLQTYDEPYLNANPEVVDLLDMIERASEKILQVVGEVLDTGRIQVGAELHRELTPLTTYLRQQMDELRFSAEESHVELRFTPAAEDVYVNIAPARFSHVVQNLITNAIKYTPSGGWVEITTQVLPSEILILVRDSGLGIPAGDLPYLFEKFYRVHDPEHQKRGGSGLGLAIVRTIMEQHGGTVRVESKPGKGSTFTVSLPRGVEVPEEKAQPSTS
jgi:two-component system, sensor histidine kinase and response regulator